jgi:S-DNA-T family DNA segregation ATPase FtsK/SpoIIIE
MFCAYFYRIYIWFFYFLAKLKNIWFWIYLWLLFYPFYLIFATSVPELGGTVGYELNLLLQDYIGKNRDTLILD